MEFAARYQDGAIADPREVICVVDLAASPVMLVVLDAATREIIDRWPAEECYLLHSRAAELRVANRGKPAGARVAVTGVAGMRTALSLLPGLARHQRRDGWKQARILALATAGLGSAIFAYLVGVPLVAGQLAAIAPPAWEIKIGDTAAQQFEAQLTGGKGPIACDADPQSRANRAITRFTTAVFDGLGSPFAPRVTVVPSAIANAFALPGGRTYYLSALLEATQTPDEFAGVLAHELGHVYHRHGMETLIATSATGLLVGFVLGDMTGLSVAGAFGSALIDNRFSRGDEAQADRFAADTARRLGFNPRGLVDLLDRVAKDDAFSRALALFSNHPLTAERRAALEALDGPTAGTAPVFDDAEWAAIKSMCPPLPPSKPAS